MQITVTPTIKTLIPNTGSMFQLYFLSLNPVYIANLPSIWKKNANEKYSPSYLKLKEEYHKKGVIIYLHGFNGSRIESIKFAEIIL